MNKQIYLMLAGLTTLPMFVGFGIGIGQKNDATWVLLMGFIGALCLSWIVAEAIVNQKPKQNKGE